MDNDSIERENPEEVDCRKTYYRFDSVIDTYYEPGLELLS